MVSLRIRTISLCQETLELFVTMKQLMRPISTIQITLSLNPLLFQTSPDLTKHKIMKQVYQTQP